LADTGAQIPGARHVRDYSLPDASGGDAGQGFSIAGFAYDDADGTWWAVNGGLNYDGSSADRQQSLVHLSADFATNLGEIDLDAVLPDLDTNDESPQAVAVDNANGYLWVGRSDGAGDPLFRQGDRRARPCKRHHAGLRHRLARAGRKRRCALGHVPRRRRCHDPEDQHRRHRATVSVDFTLDLDNRHDHLTEKDGLLYVSCGTNGAQAFVVAVDPVQETVLGRAMLPYPGGAMGLVGIEGIQFGQTGSVFIAHNGYFHYGDPGNPVAPDQWPRTNIVAEYSCPTWGARISTCSRWSMSTPRGADCLCSSAPRSTASRRGRRWACSSTAACRPSSCARTIQAAGMLPVSPIPSTGRS
jgi:hypothetical protein